MLPKDQRLNLKKDFKWVASGQKLGNNLIRLYIRQGDNLQPKVGIALSKSDFRKATERNRAKRLVSTGFQALYDKLPAGLNVVALPRPGVLELTLSDVTNILKELLKKAKLIDEKNSTSSN